MRTFGPRWRPEARSNLQLGRYVDEGARGGLTDCTNALFVNGTEVFPVVFLFEK